MFLDNNILTIGKAVEMIPTNQYLHYLNCNFYYPFAFISIGRLIWENIVIFQES